MQPRRVTALFILFVAIFAFWWGISVLSQQELAKQQTQQPARPMTLTLEVSSSTASTTPQQIQISLLASSTPAIESVLINGQPASTTLEDQ